MTTQPFAPISWVYSLCEYRQLFKLTDQDLYRPSILEFPATISSFNAQMSALGHRVVSASPFYAMKEQLMAEQARTWVEVLSVREAACVAAGEDIPSEAAEQVRSWRRVNDIFLADYAEGLQQGRYIFSGDHHLTCNDHAFDLAISIAVDRSLDEVKILAQELARVAVEFRLIFCTQDPQQSPSWLHDVLQMLQDAMYQVRFQPVDALYGSEQWVMLRASRIACPVQT